MTLRFLLALLVLVLPLPIQPWADASGGESSGMSAPVPRVAEPAQRLAPPRVNESSFQLLVPLLLSFTVALAAYFAITPLKRDRCQRRSFLVYGVMRLEGG